MDTSPKSRAFVFSMTVGVFVSVAPATCNKILRLQSSLQIAPMVVISYCYIHIVQEVRTYTKKFGVELGADIQKSISRYGKHKMDVKTTKTSALIVIGWCVAWTPYTVVALLGIFSDRSHLTPLAAHLPALFAKTAAVYNPISTVFIELNAHGRLIFKPNFSGL
nr:rhabdomeric opsin [Macrobiotus sp.]